MASIDGLGSGLDTTSIVNQLMQIERQPEDRLKSQRLGVLSEGTAWGQIGVGLSALQKAAEAITKAGTVGGTTATSSAVGTATVTTRAGAQPGSHTVSVQALASAGSYSRTAGSPTAVVGAGTLLATSGTDALGITGVGVDASATPPAASGAFSLQVLSASGTTAEVLLNGVAAHVDTSSGSFSLGGLTFSGGALTAGTAALTLARTTSPTATVADLSAQINTAGGAISSTVLTTTDPSTGTATTRLLLSATRTGTAGAVTTSTDGLTGLGPQTTVRPPSDARLTLDGLPDITRSSNTVEDLLPGVTLSLVAAGGPETTVSVAQDATAATAAAKALVTALNSVLGTVSTNTRYDIAGKKAAPLTGDSAARQLVLQLQGAVGDAQVGAAATLGGIGVTLQRDGTYALDEAAFATALSKDPLATAALAGKVAAGLGALAKQATSFDGVTKLGVASATSRAALMQTRVDQMEASMALTQARLSKQFSDLDTALGQLKSQGSWLTGQLAQL